MASKKAIIIGIGIAGVSAAIIGAIVASSRDSEAAPPPPPPNNNVTILIEDATKNPYAKVPNATVGLNNVHQVTNANGVATFTNVANGNLQVTVAATGYDALVTQISVTDTARNFVLYITPWAQNT